jgi:hypothetical protein
MLDLSRHTSEFRTRKAEEHTATARAAREARREGLAHGVIKPSCDRIVGDEGCGVCADCLDRRAAWHEQRAKGQTERFDRAAECQSEEVGHVACEGCGVTHEAMCACDIWRICVHCRSHASHERRARFGAARAVCITNAAKRGALRKVQRGGRWSERFLTLTIPHVSWIDVDVKTIPDRFAHLRGDELTLSLRVDVLFRAWRSFTRMWQKWWRARSSRAARAAFYRAFEWTPGHDGLGHPHFHVWAFSQYIDVDMVRAWWRAALVGAGLLLPADTDVVVDLRQIRTRPNEMGRELFKADKREAMKLARLTTVDRGGEDVLEYADGWSVVDMANGVRVPPNLAARLYEALEGRHVAHASRGLLPEKLRAVCPECGDVGTLHLVIDRTASEAAVRKVFGGRAPPTYANTA